MLTVELSLDSVERRLAAGEMSCPDCGGVLRGWGWARVRVLRGEGGAGLRFRPRRAICRGCSGTHVLLPVVALCRRADLVVVIGAALAARALGFGARRAALLVGRAFETVRGWLRRFAHRAARLRVYFTGLLVEAGVDPAAPSPAGDGFADAVAAIAGAGAALCTRWPLISSVSPWVAASAASRGLLIFPCWPQAGINTNRP